MSIRKARKVLQLAPWFLAFFCSSSLMASCLMTIRSDTGYGPWKFYTRDAFYCHEWIEMYIPVDLSGSCMAARFALYLQNHGHLVTVRFLPGALPVCPDFDIKAYDSQYNYIGVIRVSMPVRSFWCVLKTKGQTYSL